MWRFKSLTSHLWQTGDGGIVVGDFAPQLQRLITEKNRLIPAYRKQCDQCWLVVVADWRGPSAFFEISEKMSGERYETPFDRAYFVEVYSGRVVPLKVVHPSHVA